MVCRWAFLAQNLGVKLSSLGSGKCNFLRKPNGNYFIIYFILEKLFLQFLCEIKSVY